MTVFVFFSVDLFDESWTHCLVKNGPDSLVVDLALRISCAMLSMKDRIMTFKQIC